MDTFAKKLRRLSPEAVFVDVNKDIIICKSLYNKCFEKFNEMRSNQQLCDIKLITKCGKEVWAHKIVLAATSEYFNIMFNGEFKESQVSEIVFEQLDAFPLTILIDFIYTSKLVIVEHYIHDIISGICLLQFDEHVQNYCLNFIKMRVNSGNCLGIKETTECLGLEEFNSFCSKFMLLYYDDISTSVEFMFLTFDQILEIIKMEELCVSEKLIYKSVIKWTMFDLDNRKKHLPFLMKYVRLSTLSASFLKKIEEEPLLKAHSDCMKYLSEAYAIQKENDNTLKLTKSIRTQFRSNYSKYIIIICRIDDSGVPLLFNAVKKKWKYLKLKLPSVPHGTAFLLDDGRIINFPGPQKLSPIQNYKTLRSYFKEQTEAVIYEFGEKEIINKPTSPMFEIHDENNVAQIGSKVYVVCNYTSEYYDIEENKWFKMRYSNIIRTCLSVIAIGGYIYAIGGIIDSATDKETNLVEKYNPETDRWITVSPMKHKRKCLTLCVLNDCIYAIGGVRSIENKLTLLNEVEKYDPKSDTWEDVASLMNARHNAGATSINGLLYVFGGDTNNYSIEIYCPLRNCWDDTSLKIPRYFGPNTMCRAFTIRRNHEHNFLNFIYRLNLK